MSMIRPYHSQLWFMFRILDTALVGTSLWMSVHLFDKQLSEKFLLAGTIAMLLFYLFGEISRLYDSIGRRPVREVLILIILAWMGSIVGLLFVGWVTRATGQFPRGVMLTWLVVTPVLLAISRMFTSILLQELRLRGYYTRSVAILGAGDLGKTIGRTIHDTPALGLKLIGYFDDRYRGSRRFELTDPSRIEGDFQELLELTRRGGLDRIYIAFPLSAEERIRSLLEDLADSTVSVYLVPDFFVFNLLHGRWMNLGNISTISVFETPIYGVEGWLKRLGDIILASIILTFIMIPMALIAVGVKFSSPGPVIFKQRRYGLNGEIIEMWKFRTMRVMENCDKLVQARKSDPRITSFGAWLRRTSLDELPQFINVLQGRMSVVGPRPHAIVHNEQYRKLIPGYMLRHKVRPGITGWAQVNGWRGETEVLCKMQQRVAYDHWYIRNWSLWLDIKIVLLTFVKGFTGPQAY